MCPSRHVDTTHPGLEDSQNHSVLEPHLAASYWEGLNKEVRQNEGNHPGRLWEGNQDGLTQNSHDRNFTEPLHTSGNDQQSPIDVHEEQEPVIDLGDDVEMVDEESETNRLKNKVISELIKEEMGVWMCKACDYKHTQPVRVRYHIEN